MKIHTLQHIPFENPGYLSEWAEAGNHAMRITHLYRGETLPDMNDSDMLIIMGGPMGVQDEPIHPWLRDEKTFIKNAIESGKPILGICLGAQLIAEAMGGKIYANQEKEIGWFPVQVHGSIREHPVFQNISPEFMAFHWHGDTFTIPDGALPIGSTKATSNQGFLFKDHVLALQFHLEATQDSVEALMKNSTDHHHKQPFVQTEETIRQLTEKYVEQSNQSMARILDKWTEPFRKKRNR